MARSPVLKKRFEATKKSQAPPEQRTRFVWVEPHDTEEEMEEKKRRLIADGHIMPTDRIFFIGWKG
jgi:hypothetical protein